MVGRERNDPENEGKGGGEDGRKERRKMTGRQRGGAEWEEGPWVGGEKRRFRNGWWL